MSENTEINRLRKIANKLATLDLHVKTREEMEAEINAILQRTRNMSDEEIDIQYEEAIKEARAQAKKYAITEEDIAEEIRLFRQDNEIKQVLADYEKQYGMSTVDFFRKYIAGETDDRMDFIEWASLAQMIVHL